MGSEKTLSRVRVREAPYLFCFFFLAGWIFLSLYRRFHLSQKDTRDEIIIFREYETHLGPWFEGIDVNQIDGVVQHEYPVSPFACPEIEEIP